MLALLALCACGGGDTTTTPSTPTNPPPPPDPPRATSLRIESGSSQSGTVGSALVQNLVVSVRDQQGSPFAGATVQWSVTAGGGEVSSSTSASGADGTASVGWTLGTTAGEQAVTAAVDGINEALAFSATGVPDEPTSLVAATEAVDLAAWGQTMQLSVAAADQHGNAVSNPSVTWSSSDATVADVSPDGVVTTGLNGAAILTARTSDALTLVDGVGEVRTAVVETSVAVTVAQLNTQCVESTPQPLGGVGPAQPFVLGPEGLPIPNNPWDGTSHRVLDFDGDGDDDLIRFEYSFPSSAEYSGAVTVIENRDGVLVDATADWIDTPIIPDHPRDYEVGDFDGDGREEIFVAQHGFDADPFPGAPDLFLEAVGDDFVDSGSSVLMPHDGNSFTHGAASGDIDCDGDLDIFAVTVTPDAPSRLFMNTGGLFADASPQVPEEFLGGGLQEAEFIDFDLDGDADLFIGTGAVEFPTILLVNDGFGDFRVSDQIVLPAPRYTPRHAINGAKAADFTGDGLPDLLLFEIPEAFSSVSTIRLWENMGDGTFTDIGVEWGLPEECTGEVIEPLFVDDFNGDGWADFLIPLGCQETGGVAAIAINTGGSFQITPITSFRPWFEFAMPHPFDLDGDGDLDLYVDQNGGPVILRNTTVGGE